MTLSQIHKRTVKGEFLDVNELRDVLKSIEELRIDVRLVNELLFHFDFTKLSYELTGWNVYNPIQDYKEPTESKLSPISLQRVKLCLIGSNVFHFVIPYLFLSREFSMSLVWVREEQLGVINNIINRLIIIVFGGKQLLRSEINKINEREYRDSYVFHKLNYILDKSFIRKFPLGIINDHWGTLPFYRGKSTFQYQDLFGHRKYITNHLIEASIDTGDIIAFHRIKGPLFYEKYILLFRRIKVSVNMLVTGRSLVKNDSSHGATFYKMHPRLKRFLNNL